MSLENLKNELVELVKSLENFDQEKKELNKVSFAFSFNVSKVFINLILKMIIHYFQQRTFHLFKYCHFAA